MSTTTHTVKIAITSFALGAAVVGSIALSGYHLADKSLSVNQAHTTNTSATLATPRVAQTRDEFGLMHETTLYSMDNNTSVMMYTVHNHLESVSISYKGQLINVARGTGNKFEVMEYSSAK